MKNLNEKSQQFMGFQSLSRAEMKSIVGGETSDPSPCANVTCPAGTTLHVTQISPSAYICSCVGAAS